MKSQAAILEPQCDFACYLTGHRRLGVDAGEIRDALVNIECDSQLVVGIGAGLA